MFKNKNNAEKNKEQQIKYFQTTVERGLLPTNKSRPEIYTAITYLSTIVKYTNTNYWKNLRCMMRVQEIMEEDMK